MLLLGIVQPSCSSWASPLNLVSKKNPVKGRPDRVPAPSHIRFHGRKTHHYPDKDRAYRRNILGKRLSSVHLDYPNNSQYHWDSGAQLRLSRDLEMTSLVDSTLYKPTSTISLSPPSHHDSTIVISGSFSVAFISSGLCSMLRSVS